MISFSNATYVNMVEPYNATIYNNGNVILGKVGPGQVFYLAISSSTTNVNGIKVNEGWNKLLIVNAPVGWFVENSPLYISIISTKIVVPGNVKYGLYNFTFRAVNIGNYSKVGNLTFNASVNVTPNVFKLSVYPKNVTAGPGQPTPIYVVINNTGVSDSPFIISASGLPAWNYTATVIALHHTTKIFKYPIYENEPGLYDTIINVTSSASPLIHKNVTIIMNVQSSIINNYKAIGEGAITFPIIYAPVYAIMNIIGKFFN
jgi:hypothetical protein